ncbi:hypothetical protein ACSYGO_36495 [Streptomyces krungchingensis]
MTARADRCKADQDPVDWLPLLLDARCTYPADWVAAKLRWQLTGDDREREALGTLAADCGQRTVEYELAP